MKNSIFKRILRIMIIIGSLLGMLTFFIPIANHIVNIGGIAGFSACAVIFFCCLFSKNLAEKLKILWINKIGKAIIIFISVFLAAGIIMISIFSFLMIKAINNSPKRPHTVVVLGCKLNGETPSLMLEYRLDAAEKYLKENPNVACVVTGGQGNNELIPEAHAMKKYLLAKGIAENRIFVEDRSTNTFENMKFTKEILDKYNLGNEIVIVTDGFHQYRAGVFAKETGLEFSAVSAKTKPLYIPTYWVREWFGIVKQAFS